MNEESATKRGRGRPKLERSFIAYVANKADAFEMGDESVRYFSEIEGAANFFGVNEETIARVSKDKHVIRGRKRLDWLLFSDEEKVSYVQEKLGRTI